MRSLRALLIVLAAAVALPAAAQTASDMQILRDKIKADKKLLVAANMQLTDAEAKAFWPVYDAYQKDLEAINRRTGKVILTYAEAYKKDSLSDAQAKTLIDEAIAIEEAEVKLRKDYSAKLGKALPGKKVARYLQIENKIRAVLRYELAAEIPLAQ